MGTFMAVRNAALFLVESCSWKNPLRTLCSSSNSWKENAVKSGGNCGSVSKPDTNRTDDESDVHVPGRFVDVSGLFAHVHNVLLRDGASRSPPRLSASHGPAGWRCRLEVTWPQPARYEADARSKREATRRAKAHMIRFLQDQGLLEANGDPVLATAAEEGPQNSEPAPGQSEVRSEVQLPARFGSSCSLYQHVWAVVGRDLPGAGAPRLSASRTRDGWQARLRVTWPEPAQFLARAGSRRQAVRRVRADMLRSLQGRGLLSGDGEPVLFSRKEQRQRLAALQGTPGLSVPTRLLPEIEQLHQRLQEVRQTVNSGLQALEAGGDWDQWQPEQDSSQGGLADLFGGSEERWSPKRLQQRSERLLAELSRRRRLAAEPGSREAELDRAQRSLPVHAWSSEILSAVSWHPVVIVRGETGSGKSTRVPALLLEEATEAGRGALCNVLVTQPRRLSATSLARHVAHSRGEQLGAAVGYSVRLDSRPPRERGGVLFCTTGVLLSRLRQSLSLSGVSHLVIDEVHERSVETDLLLLLVRRLQPLCPGLRVVLMSASADTALLSRYFDGAPVIDVPGRVFPVEQYLLEDLPAQLSVPPAELAELGRRDQQERPGFCAEPVARVVEAVCRQRPPGAVLVFLEGTAEIRQVEGCLRRLLPEASVWLLPVAGRLSASQQAAIFGHPPPGVRKVVLATNVAETGITVDDVVYVVDTGAAKQTRLDPETGLSCLRTEWISQASASQRQGRAGRVQPGEIYRLYSADRLRQMERHDTPELLRAPLETVVLDAKHLCPEVPAAGFLSGALQPPPEEAVRAALLQLTALRLLDGPGERLTALGRLAGRLQLHPRLVRLLLYGVMLRCVEPVLTLAGWESCGREPFSVSLEGRPRLLEVKRRHGGSSDHRAAVLLQRGFRRSPDRAQYCEENMLFRNGMFTVQSLVRQFSSQLERSGLVERHSEDLLSPDHPLNRLADHWPTVTGTLIAGPMRNVARVQRGAIVKGRLRPQDVTVRCSEGPADTVGDSVNRRLDGGRPFLAYSSAFFSSQRRRHVLRDTTQTTALQTALFYGDRCQARDQEGGSDQEILRLSCGGQHPLHVVGERSAVRGVQQLREVLEFGVWRQLEAAVADCRFTRGLLCPPEVAELHERAVRLTADLLDSEADSGHGPATGVRSHG